uniref:Ubiquitin specific peptidase 18 n=1 Tax=Myripristis murdjan TaxID=586833 RepID=A0A668AWS5_9TELE
ALNRVRGLMNDGLSCCVNTLLQCFSATWELTELLNRWKPVDIQEANHNVPLQLQKALRAMQSDQIQPAPHHDFLHCLDRNRIRRMINTQHDAEEVFLRILNRIQQQMDNEVLAGDIQNLFKISVETHLQCSECSSVQSMASYLLNLPLHIREGHNSLDGCITSFFEPQELRGRNSCLCAWCGKRTPSKQVRTGFNVLVSLPPVLCVQLHRFRSDCGYTRKLDCTVTFPETFDFLENLKEEAFSRDFGDCKYVLYAVVVHSGSAVFGHYTAYVRPKGSHGWYYANDSHVQEVGPEQKYFKLNLLKPALTDR